MPSRTIRQLIEPMVVLFHRISKRRQHYISKALVLWALIQIMISQLGTISTPEARILTVQVWDKGMVKAVDKAIRDAGLGLNPQMDGQLLRIPIPELERGTAQGTCPSWPTNMPKPPGSRCAMCAATAWNCSKARKRPQDRPGRAPQAGR